MSRTDHAWPALTRTLPPGACGSIAGYCICTLPRHPAEEPHQCRVDGCGGSWVGCWFDATFRVVRFPGGQAP